MLLVESVALKRLSQAELLPQQLVSPTQRFTCGAVAEVLDLVMVVAVMVVIAALPLPLVRLPQRAVLGWELVVERQPSAHVLVVPPIAVNQFDILQPRQQTFGSQRDALPSGLFLVEQ
jgi:hypothetical protein